jgi:hypothetical protein
LPEDDFVLLVGDFRRAFLLLDFIKGGHAGLAETEVPMRFDARILD